MTKIHRTLYVIMRSGRTEIFANYHGHNQFVPWPHVGDACIRFYSAPKNVLAKLRHTSDSVEAVLAREVLELLPEKERETNGNETE